MEYREDPPTDPSEHLALDSFIDYELALIFLREELKYAMKREQNLEEQRLLLSECEDITTDIDELPVLYRQFLFRNF